MKGVAWHAPCIAVRRGHVAAYDWGAAWAVGGPVACCRSGLQRAGGAGGSGALEKGNRAEHRTPSTELPACQTWRPEMKFLAA